MKEILFYGPAMVVSIILSGYNAPKISELSNIVLIFADDQTYTAVRALGNREIKTPH